MLSERFLLRRAIRRASYSCGWCRRNLLARKGPCLVHQRKFYDGLADVATDYEGSEECGGIITEHWPISESGNDNLRSGSEGKELGETVGFLPGDGETVQEIDAGQQ